MQPAGRFVVAASHPSLSGHFPDNPVAPGVLLLDEALACLHAAAGSVVELVSAKFTAPVRPGDTIDVAWRDVGGRMEFACSVAGAPVLRGAAMRR